MRLSSELIPIIIQMAVISLTFLPNHTASEALKGGEERALRGLQTSGREGGGGETGGGGGGGALGVDIYKFNVLHVPRLQPVFGQQNHLAVPLFHLLSPGGSWIRSLLRYHELTPFRLDLTENGSANTRNSADESSFYFNFIKHKQFYATLVCSWLFQM